MKIYTRKGDNAITSLSGGKKIPKHHVRVEAYGAIDELVSWIGLLKDHKENSGRKAIMTYIQKQLLIFTALLASDNCDTSEKLIVPDPRSVQKLEKEIDKIQLTLLPLQQCIIPGGDVLVSYCHIARCVCRRTERRVSELNESEKTPAIIGKFLNRLSDYLFVLSRKIALELDIEEVIWSV